MLVFELASMLRMLKSELLKNTNSMLEHVSKN